MSHDGERSISIISFIGSVFSPWYRWSGRKSPDNHCCINVATYGPGGRWTMTDRGRDALRQTRDTFEVGPSKLTWAGGKLVFDIDEMTWPHMGRLKGRVTVTPSAVTGVELPLKADGSHVWRPFAPSSEIEVDLNQPGWQWKGHGYFDANFGTAALEDDFSYWTWGRFPTKANGAWCFYDASMRDGSELAVGVHFDADGRAEVAEAPPRTRFPRSKWLVRRETRADPGYKPRQVHDMLDAPFYCRSAIRTKVFGEEVVGVHEALDLDRFASPLIKPMLAVKVPRKPGWSFPT
ncbi:carotenoid 1,2-hydratase [Rhodovulum sulfidophilum]|uniref:carotenoid 1,2-hydratase n=1 Tax=Rhodovulum sulfidophilum TaxID=35806 RepID=UPI002DD42101|nr:carotenoid 1,2-hydratase [Rhodovulum sulfidophilum]